MVNLEWSFEIYFIYDFLLLLFVLFIIVHL